MSWLGCFKFRGEKESADQTRELIVKAIKLWLLFEWMRKELINLDEKKHTKLSSSRQIVIFMSYIGAYKNALKNVVNQLKIHTIRFCR